MDGIINIRDDSGDMAKTKKAPIFIFLLMSVIGTGVMLYPTVSDQINSFRQTRAIAAYHTELTHASREKLQALLVEAERYNEQLRSLNGKAAGSDVMHAAYNKTLRLDVSDVMGYIEIPKIDVYLPIFHGTDQSVLAAGVGHLEGTTLPIGGENTHSALSGHRGLPTAKLFTNLDKMEIGDMFMVHVLNQTLYYEVENINVVLPDEVDHLSIEPGKDLVTLITCTPYGINTHRMLVTGSRVIDMDLPEGAIPLGAPLQAFDWQHQPVKFPFQSQVILASAALALVIKIILELRQKRLKEEYAQFNKQGVQFLA